MKAERRHELETNTLAGFLSELPILLRFYADKILLVLVIILLAIVLVRWKINSNRERAARIGDQLGVAQASVRELWLASRAGGPQQIAERRKQVLDEASVAIKVIADEAGTDEAVLRAEALVAQGDLYWTAANLPDLPGATTQPALQLPQTRDDFLKQAEVAWQNAIKTYPDQRRANIAAMFGLAAIAEERREFDSARRQYEDIVTTTDVEMYKNLAEMRVKLIEEIRDPLLIGTLATKPEPLTPLMLAPATAPATQPATAPGTLP